MNLEEMRNRVQAIVAKLTEFSSLENFSDEQLTEINALNDEFGGLEKQISAKETLKKMNASAAVSNRVVAPVVPAGQVTVTNRTDKTMGFDSLGNFAKAVSNKAMGKVDQRFQNEAAYERFSEDGGVLVPTDFMTEIQEKVEGDESLLARSANYKVSGNHLSLPIDETSPWNGGIQSYWTAEGQTINESKPKLGSASWKLHKLASLVKATDELLEDASALESYIKRNAPKSITATINDAIIGGNGVGKPSGILGSGFKVTVAKEAVQTPDTINYKNIVKMEAVHIPSMDSIWIAHPQCREQLRQLKDDNGNAIYMNGGAFPNLAVKGFDMLMGKPVIYMMGATKALGDEGDLILADMNYYYSIVKTEGIKQSISTHLLFDKDMTAFKFITRVDGSCPFTSPVTTQYGDYKMSGFVTLADRA